MRSKNSLQSAREPDSSTIKQADVGRFAGIPGKEPAPGSAFHHKGREQQRINSVMETALRSAHPTQLTPKPGGREWGSSAGPASIILASRMPNSHPLVTLVLPCILRGKEIVSIRLEADRSD